MKLTEREFFSFNLKSQIQILRDKGICLFTNNTVPDYQIKAYLIFNFYVKVIINEANKKIINILLMDEAELAGFVVDVF